MQYLLKLQIPYPKSFKIESNLQRNQLNVIYILLKFESTSNPTWSPMPTSTWNLIPIMIHKLGNYDI